MNPADATSGITIVICTFNRHALLRQALESIAALRNPQNIPLEVIVVDNSDDGNALEMIATMRAAMPCPLAGLAAHPANISVARNAGAAAATTGIVAFLDDDQRLDAGWLEAVAEGLARYPHDVFFGAVEPVMEAPERADATVHMLFSRHPDLPTGTDLFAMGPQKTPGISLATNNSIFRRATTLTGPMPFDPAFGNGGGEDFDLFCRLQRQGRRFGWLPAARAAEFVPASRCDHDYLARRFFAGGQAYALAIARNSSAPRLTRWRLRAMALAQLLLLLPRWLTSRLEGPEARNRLRHRMAGVLGKLSLRRLEPIYSNTGQS